MDVDPARIRAFQTASGFGDWLAEHHAAEGEIWLRIYKKSSGVPSLSWVEAVVEALAWGWIDGIKKAEDSSAWLQRFTPRKARSNWSRINRQHAETLIATGRMQPPGLQAVLAAKTAGRWDAACGRSSAMEFPQPLLDAIAADDKAKEAFGRLSRSDLYRVYLRLGSAKREETRQRLMSQFLKELSR